MKQYQESHRHPLNRTLHSIGIPMIAVSLPLVFWQWQIAAVLFVAGWILQFVGHAIEGNKPAFFDNPIHLISGLVWWVKKFVPASWSKS